MTDYALSDNVILALAATLLCALAGTACGSLPPVVPEAQGVKAISAISMGCNKPYKLTQDCSGFSGATRLVELNEVAFKIAGNEDGTIVFVMDAKPNRNAYAGRSVEAANLAFEVAKRALIENDIEIRTAEPVASGGLLVGYVLTTDKNAYSVLSQHTVVE
jgi:hypothetical protein